MYWPSFLSRSCLVPSFAISEFPTRTVRLFYNACCSAYFPYSASWGQHSVQNIQVFLLPMCCAYLPSNINLVTPFAKRNWSQDTSGPHQSRLLIFDFLLLFKNAGVRGANKLLYIYVPTHSCICPLFISEI